MAAAMIVAGFAVAAIDVTGLAATLALLVPSLLLMAAIVYAHRSVAPARQVKPSPRAAAAEKVGVMMAADGTFAGTDEAPVAEVSWAERIQKAEAAGDAIIAFCDPKDARSRALVTRFEHGRRIVEVQAPFLPLVLWLGSAHAARSRSRRSPFATAGLGPGQTLGLPELGGIQLARGARGRASAGRCHVPCRCPRIGACLRIRPGTSRRSNARPMATDWPEHFWGPT